jgi:hypothetical protein
MGIASRLMVEDADVLTQELRTAGSVELALDTYVACCRLGAEWIMKQSRAMVASLA